MKAPAKSVLWALAVLASLVLLAGLVSTGGVHPVRAANPLPAAQLDEPRPAQPTQESVVLAGGCFWGMQLVFEHVRGVASATAGYAGGVASTANYDTVSTGSTGHAESVRVVYDPAQVSLGTLLRVYFSVAHDPTELDFQGPDQGTQYRSAIFYANPEQYRIARAYIAQLQAARAFRRPIVTVLTPLTAQRGFYPAEAYHQNYAEHNPDDLYIRINDLPKLAALRSQWPALSR
ncbi:MAG TPA: peptide-methionine (S)-S-oxide reductase MsrA [Terriglobales bacterium]|nr:peptide-methionine (S)-S-oxide reductase MsrA [Terriglobales bacterium]